MCVVRMNLKKNLFCFFEIFFFSLNSKNNERIFTFRKFSRC